MESFNIKNLTFAYPGQTEPILKNLNLSFDSGDFILLCGPSGCGKSTLLRHLKTVLTPHGVTSGEILFEGMPLAETDQRTQSAKIGYVMQSPDNQIVTDKVWHELAFGLESLGYDTPHIRRRVAEMASFFGIEEWFRKDVGELSGGQKQMLNLASIMAMQPSVLVLDEPTSQLDPIAAADFLATVGKINRELGTTIIMTEHRLEEVFPLCGRVLIMDGGNIIFDGPPQDTGAKLKAMRHSMFLAMPAPVIIHSALASGSSPVTVRGGKNWLIDYAAAHQPTMPPKEEKTFNEDEPAAELRDIWFRYAKEQPDILRGLSLKLHQGEFLAVLGGNGVGKSTMLSLLSGMRKPYRGEVLLGGKLIGEHTALYDKLIGVLPQNPQALFVKNTVWEDLLEMLSDSSFSRAEREKRAAASAGLCRLEGLLDRHPYDLSGGEQQRAALAKVLLNEPQILLLDEPTKGFDAEFKRIFAGIIGRLKSHGVAVMMVSHDIEFCAKYTDRCVMLFDGEVAAEAPPTAFFAGNSFYTTAANRMARTILPEAVTSEDVISAFGGSLPETDEQDSGGEDYFRLHKSAVKPPKEDRKKLPLWRRVTAWLSGAAFIALLTSSFGVFGLRLPFENKNISYGLLLGLLTLFAAAVSRKSEKPPIQTEKDKRALNKRTMTAAVMILLAIPFTIYIGVSYLGDRKYLFISLLVLVETMLPFFMVFESRKPQARELVLLAVLCGIAVAGRAAFAMLPQVKPVLALIIIVGVALGGESGFLVGAMTAFVSNFFLSAGPWTPWQMFGLGIVGFLAGVLFKKGLLRRGRLPLAIFGALSALIIYGGIMNPASVLMFQTKITWPMLAAAYATGFPMDLIHAAATAIFLWLISGPMLEKLDRIKVKYGLLEP